LTIHFYKYQGAGNDFVMIDDRNRSFIQERKLIEKICDRHFGIGADGLVLLQDDAESDFRMAYFNSDGRESTMCGNGGRCATLFARKLGIIENKTEFNAIDGIHQAVIEGTNIRLKMTNVSEVLATHGFVFLNTGSPHHVEFVQDADQVNVKKRGAAIRYGSPYFDEGANVNFVEALTWDTLKIRTYERGVEDETLACGTGVTAAAIAAFHTGVLSNDKINVETRGGNLMVAFKKNASGGYEDVWLTGPAEFVFEGTIDLKDPR